MLQCKKIPGAAGSVCIKGARRLRGRSESAAMSAEKSHFCPVFPDLAGLQSSKSEQNWPLLPLISHRRLLPRRFLGSFRISPECNMDNEQVVVFREYALVVS